MFAAWTGIFFLRDKTEKWVGIQHRRWPFTGARWHHVHECAFALGPAWLSLSIGIFSLTPRGIVLSHAWTELLACSAYVRRRQRRDTGIQMNLKSHHPLLEERAFSQDLGFRWDTAVFPKGWCAMLGQVKGAEQRVAQWSPHLPWWLMLQVAPAGALRVSPQGIPRRGQGKTCSRAMGSALAALRKAGSNGEPAAWLLCKGAETVCWKY